MGPKPAESPQCGEAGGLQAAPLPAPHRPPPAAAACEPGRNNRTPWFMYTLVHVAW